MTILSTVRYLFGEEFSRQSIYIYIYREEEKELGEGSKYKVDRWYRYPEVNSIYSKWIHTFTLLGR